MPDLLIMEGSNLFCQAAGESKHLTLTELALPTMQEMFQDHHAGGSRFQIEVAVGIEKPTASFKLAGWDQELLQQFGLSEDATQIFTARGSLRSKATGTLVSAVAVTRDGAPVVFTLSVLDVGVSRPTNATPSNGATDLGGAVTMTSSAFSWVGVADVHQSSDWQMATDSGFTNLVASASASGSDLTSWSVSGLTENTTYYWRVRHNGTNNGSSPWSVGTAFTTAILFGGHIGRAGMQGFGVGSYPADLPPGFSAMAGTNDPASQNYGNYQYSDGSIMVFIPKFYYRVGHASSPHFSQYGGNAIDIASAGDFSSTSDANAAGYALHRAFIDGGSVRSGFFIDKYQAVRNGSSSVRSVAGEALLSLCSDANVTRTGNMSGGLGKVRDALKLAQTRGSEFNCASIFMYSALALLSLAHGQAANGVAHCAWYGG